MTYHHQTIAAYPQQTTVSARGNNSRLPSRQQTSPFVRIECQSTERHFPMASTPYIIESSWKPIKLVLNNTQKPLQYRSEITVHNNPDTKLHIKRLRVAFRYDDKIPNGTTPQNHQRSSSSTSLSTRSQSAHASRSESKGTDGTHHKRRPVSLSHARSQNILHRWIDDICANEQLMADDDIVFFLKNGEFYARI